MPAHFCFYDFTSEEGKVSNAKFGVLGLLSIINFLQKPKKSLISFFDRIVKRFGHSLEYLSFFGKHNYVLVGERRVPPYFSSNSIELFDLSLDTLRLLSIFFMRKYLFLILLLQKMQMDVGIL